MIYDCIIDNNKENPEKTAIIDTSGRYSYSLLYNDIIKFVNYLIQNNVTSKKVGIFLENSYEAIVSIYACSMIDVLVIPLNTNLMLHQLNKLVKEFNIQIILTKECKSFALNEIKCNKIINIKIIKTLKDINISNINKYITTDVLKSSFMFFTTGTTGLSKGVLLNNKTLQNTTDNINSVMQLKEHCIESLPIPITHSFGFGRIRCVFDKGGTVIIEDGLKNIGKLINNIIRYNANGFSTVPVGISLLLKLYRVKLEEIKDYIDYIEIGSSTMKYNEKIELMNALPNCRIYMHYGLTEASRSTFIEFNSELKKLNTIGRAAPNVEVKILDIESNKYITDEVGEIIIKGNNIFNGYYNTNIENYLHNGYFKSGDLGKIDKLGYITYLGRINDIINIGGLKVSPDEIEKIIIEYKGIDDAAVIGQKDEHDIHGVIITAFIVAHTNINIKELKNHCLNYLQPYKIPNIFKFVQKLPKSSSGKLKRKDLQHNDNTK